jgi:hypothetical protein
VKPDSFCSKSFISAIYDFRTVINPILKMAAQTQGIQQLLTAEKRAAEKVNEARKRKARRLKQAKDEAQAEIQKYREVGATSTRKLLSTYRSAKRSSKTLRTSI